MLSDVSGDSLNSLEEIPCTCVNRPDSYAVRIRREAGKSAPWHGDPDRPGNCACTCRQCDADRALWVIELDKLLHPPPTAAELEEAWRENTRRDAIKAQEQHRAEMQAWRESPEGKAELARRAEANYQYWKRTWEAEQARYSALCIYRPCLNRSSLDGEHDYDDGGTAAEQVKAIRLFIQLHAERFGLFVYLRDLAEYDQSFSPPARKITRPAALKDLIARMLQADEDEDEDEDESLRQDPRRLPRLWKFDEYGSLRPGGSVEDVHTEVWTQLVAAARWDAPDAPAAVRGQLALPPGEVYAEVLPALADQLVAVGREMPDGKWYGTKAVLAQLVGFASTQVLNAELSQLAPELALLGIELARTGRRTGSTKAVEWELKIPETVLTSSLPLLPGQGGEELD